MTLPLPEAFRATFDGLEEQRLSAEPDNSFHQCFGCGPAHPAGLHVRTFKTGEGVASPIVVSRQHEGPPGAAHGGIVAAYLDEVLAATVLRVTGRLGGPANSPSGTSSRCRPRHRSSGAARW